jgi:hypothetical protein
MDFYDAQAHEYSHLVSVLEETDRQKDINDTAQARYADAASGLQRLALVWDARTKDEIGD